MTKTITLTRPNGLKFEVMVDEISLFKEEKGEYWIFLKNKRYEMFTINESEEQLKKLLAEAKKEDEKCSLDERTSYHYIIAEKNKEIEDLKQQLAELTKSSEKTTNLTREEMLKAIDEGKTVKCMKDHKLVLFGDSSMNILNKNTRWEIVE